MTIRVITCKPFELPEEIYLDESTEVWMAFLLGDKKPESPEEKKFGWFEVLSIGRPLLLYCLEHAINEPFNRMLQGRPIFGNFIISKINSNGNKINLSDEEVNRLMAELSIPQPNTTN